MPVFGRSILLLAVMAASLLGATLQAADPPAPSLSAKIDGKAWVATRQIAVTFRFGPDPALNITGFRDGPPTSRLSFNLVLPSDDDYAHDFVLGPAAAQTSHGSFTFNVMDPDVPANAFNSQSGRLSVSKYDAATETVSGSFFAIATNPANTRTLQITEGTFANIPVQGGR